MLKLMMLISSMHNISVMSSTGYGIVGILWMLCCNVLCMLVIVLPIW